MIPGWSSGRGRSPGRSYKWRWSGRRRESAPASPWLVRFAFVPFLPALWACGSIKDTGRPPDTDLDETANADDTGGDTGVDKDSSPPRDSAVTITNRTMEAFATIWVCDRTSCLVDTILDPSYAAPGTTVVYEVESGDTILAVIDETGGCDVTGWFTLDPGETYAWEVVGMSGEWTSSNEFGCAKR